VVPCVLKVRPTISVYAEVSLKAQETPFNFARGLAVIVVAALVALVLQQRFEEF